MHKIIRQCKKCNKEFWIELYRIKDGEGKYCSRKCAGTEKKKEIEKKCKKCRKSFKTTDKEIKRGWGIYCSKSCAAISLGGSLLLKKKGEKHPAWKGGKIKIICKVCGKEKHFKSSDIKRGHGKFCSNSCKSIFTNIHHIKQKNTDIERLIEDELIHRNIPYTKQVPLLGLTIVDFLLPHDIIIYADGEYWHNKKGRKERDMNQDFILTFHGYKVFRFTGKDIKKSAKKCIDKVLK